MAQQFNQNQFQNNSINATVNCFAALCQSAILGINKMLNITVSIKKDTKYLFVTKINRTFALQTTTYSFSNSKVTLIQDNTPSRLAAMQHTWEVFSFYTFIKYQNCNENL
jgi:hypothetical protein